MDVRQLAFLAGQPSAAVKPREHFCGMPKRGLAFILANALFWQPLLAQADGIVVSGPGTSLGQAGNGVPIVNIAAPNASGLSHNQFHDYNVGANGVILNNATHRTQATQLGGIILGNPNFNGAAAQTILNEVNGGSPSQLRGYTEVAGQSARVIVANPYRISCNGCGFINTPRVTLTTGKPVLDNGRLERFQVDQGSVSIDGAGLNATNVDSFEIITRSAKINAEIQARNLTIVAGRNDVNADSLNATARADDGSTKPELAIDSTALGGMYAGAIKLVGTEAGVGVKLDGKLIASGGDIQLDANGHLSMVDTSATGAVNVKTASLNAQGPVYAGTALNVQTQGALTNQQTLAARDSITLSSAGQLTNNGIIEAGVNADTSRNTNGDVSLSAQNLNNSGKSVIASRNLTINTAQTLNNQGGTLSARQSAKITAATLDNQNNGRVLSNATLELNADQLLNSQGLITSNGNLSANLGHLNNRNGELSSLASATLRMASLDNVAGLVMAGNTLDIGASGLLNNQNGRLAATQNIQLKAASLDNSQLGSIISQGALGVTVSDKLANQQSGRIEAKAAARINAGSFDNQQSGTLTSSNTLNLTAGHVNNSEGGKIASAMALTASVMGLDQHDKGQLYSNTELSLDLNHGQLNNQNALINAPGQLLLKNLNGVVNRGGEISSANAFNLNADSLDNNAGKILSEQALVLRINRALDNTKGLISAASMDLQAASLNNTGGKLNATHVLGMTLEGDLDNREGKISSRDTTLSLAQLDNRQGLLAGDASLRLRSTGAVNNTEGSMTAGNALVFESNSLDNTQGSLISDGALTARIAEYLLNQSGLLSSSGVLTLNSASLDNQGKGRISSKSDLNVATGALLDNRSGSLTASGELLLNAARLDNRQGGLLTAAKATNLRITALDNRGGEVSSQGSLTLSGTELNNSDTGRLIAYGDLRLTFEQLHNQIKGLISGRAAVHIDATQLDNSQGTLKSDGTSTLKVAGLSNDGGQLSSVGALKIDSAGILSNLGGRLISTDTLDLTAGQVNNADGRIASTKALTASVTGLDQNNGELFSNTALSLDLNHGQLNNHDGLINTPGQLLLKNLNGVANLGGEISSDQAFSLTATSLDNSAGEIISKQNLTVRIAQALTNVKGLVSANGLDVRAASLDNSGATLGSDADLTLNIDDTLTNASGEISSAALTRLTAATLNNSNGQVLGDNALNIDLSGVLDNRDGVLGSGKLVDIKAASLDNRDAGSLVSDGSLTARISGLLDNQNNGELIAKGVVDLHTGSLDNRGGHLTGQDLLTLRSDSADNRGGAIRADKDLQLFVEQLDNRDQGLISGKAGIGYDGTRLDNQGGLLTGVGPLTLTAREVQNGLGRISSQSDLTATIGLLQQQGGALVAQGNLSLTGANLDNRNGGLVGSTKALTLKVDDIDNRGGELSSSLGLNVNGQRLDNSDGGKLLAGIDLELKVSRLINQNTGLIQTKGVTTLSGTRLDNAGGTLDSLNGLVITLDDALDNRQGLISSEGLLTVNAASIDNSAGNLGSAGALSLTSRGTLLNRGGSVSTDANLTLGSVSLDNSQKGLLSGKGLTKVSTGTFDNSQGGRLTSGNALDLTATQVNNATGRIASDQALTASVTGLDQQDGELFSKTSLSLDLNQGQLNNQGGLINAPGALLLKNLKGVNNQKGEISSQQAFTLAAQNLDNSNGKLLSNQGLTLRIAQALNNVKGLISAASLDSHSDSLDNSEGLISSYGRLDLGADTSLNNQKGAVIADGVLALSADSLDNRSGEIAGKADVTATLNSLDNQQGKLITTGALKLTAGKLDNRQGGLLGATKALTLTVDELDNRGGELTSNANVTLVSKKLDNSDSGQIFAGQALSLTVDQLLNRNQGLLNARTALGLDGRLLDNTGGNLLSLHSMRVNLTGALDNTQGQLSSEGTLNVKAATLTNTQGSLSSAAGLTISSEGSISNQGGELVTDAILTLNSASLDNRQQGTISGKGAVAVTTGAFDNSQNGRLNSASTLDLTASQVTNQDGGRIGSDKALTASVTGLDQQGGNLFSNTSLSLDLKNGQLNNQGGLINAPGALLLKNLNGVANQGGEISSGQAFTLAATTLDNSNGRLLSSQGLTLRLNQALSNVKGLIGAAALDVRAASLNNSGGTLTSRGDLDLTVDGLLNNSTQGLINAAQSLKLSSADLNNQGGSILGTSAVTLNAMALDNRANGLINSQGNLTLTATTLDSSTGGEVSAKGDIGLTLIALTQNGGRLLGDKAVTLDLANGDLDNRNGLLTAKGPLTLNRLRDLNNQSGEVSSSQSFTVTGRTLDNSAGKLISSQQLNVNGTTLINQNGLISGWQGLSVGGTSLDNRNTGTLSSRNGNVAIDLSGGLLNSNNGALVSQGSLSVKASSLDNSNTGILSSGAGQTLTLGGTLNNSAGGLIDSGAGLAINSAILSNASGTLNAQQALSFIGTTLDNSNGTLVGNGAVTLDLLGALTNTNGKLASAGPLRVQRSTQINNQGGQLASQGLMTLLTGGLDNRNRGTVAASDQLTVTTGGAVQNSGDGLIYSQNAGLHLQAASLANGKGALQSQNGLTLDISGNFDNQSGKVIAQNGDVSVKAANIDNRGGVLSSIKGALEARTVGVLRNGYDLNNNRQGGIVQGQRLNLTALAGIDNYGGRISAQTGDAMVTTTDFDNRNGGLYAQGRVSVTGNNFDNSGDNDGQIAGNQIDLNLSGALNNRLGIIESDTTLAIKATSLDNQTGKLRALGSSGKTNFQIGSLFDNRNGTLESANADLTLAAGSFQNSGGQLLHVGDGTFDISLPNVTGAGGSIVTRGGLTLNADSWTNSSVIQAGRLNVNVNNFTQTASGQLLASTRLEGKGGNWTNDGLIASDGSLDLRLSGRYGGNGRVSSLGSLELSAGQLDLGAATSIAGGGDTLINVGGQLTNYGRLTSNSGLTINAAGISNHATLGSANNLTITTNRLLNEGASENSHSLISSGADMALRVGSFTNRFATVYSLGGLVVSRDAANNRVDLLENISANLQSDQGMSLNASTITNRKDAFSMTEKLLSGTITYSCINCKGRHYDLYYYLNEQIERTLGANAASSSISAGTNLTVGSETFTNQHSLVAAGQNLSINTGSFVNEGASTESVTRARTFRNPNDSERFSVFTGLVSDGGAVAEYAKYNSPTQYEYLDQRREPGGGFEIIPIGTDHQNTGKANPDYNPGAQYAVPAKLLTYTLVNSVETATGSSSGNASANAVVQAGGAVSINASMTLGNGATKPNVGYGAGALQTADTSAGVKKAGTVVKINAQLPPDLAQQQVNPLALPGFSLPAGQNGLFRLSGQGATSQPTAQAPSGPQSWTMGGASLSPAERQVSLPTAPGREIQIGQVTQVSASDRSLVQSSHQRAGLDVSASTFNVAPPTEAGIGGIQLSGHNSNSDAITRVSDIGADLPGQSQVGVTRPDPGAGWSGSQRDPLVSVNTPFAVTTPSTAGPVPIGTRPSTAAQTVARVTGLPSTSVPSKPHKYLIETNPVLTELKPFMSSDYLLKGLGYDPDQSAKRLGDGFYEQRLIQQAVVARTGQRFIDGQTSDEGLFKYLMNNAIASKNQLNLSMGVTLTSQQVAALTHDIVWLEEHEVNGEKVLVPVLYMAQANNRLAPNGALIAGQDVTLIAGENLNNVGTLRASNNLSANAGNNLVNSGLIEAGNRLDLLAGNDLINKSGGIISGRDISLTAVRGDVINERTVTGHDSSTRSGTQHRDYLDNAARIEASNDLSIEAGRDISNKGGVLQSGRDLDLNAGRDVSISSIQERTTDARGSRYLNQQVTQHGAEVTAGRDLSVSAGRDISAIASRLDAKRDIALESEGDITLASAADESQYASRSKKTTLETRRVTQQSTELNAGRDISIDAGKDLGIIASRIKAGADIDLDAGQDITIASAKDESSYYYLKKKKGSFGRSSSTQKENYDSTNVASEIDAGNDLTVNTSKDEDGGISLDGGRDVAIIGSQLKAGNDLVVGATNDVAVLSGVEEHGSYSKKTKSGFLGLSKSGKSQLKTTATQVGSELSAGNDAVIAAGNDVRLRASEISAENDAELRAGLVKNTGDINLVSANDQAYSLTEEYKKKVGLSLKDTAGLFAGTPGAGADITLNAAKKAGREAISSTSVGSQVNADRDATLNAERDINIIGSGVSAGRTVTLGAGRDVNVVAGTNQQQDNSWEINKSYGIKQDVDSNGFTTFVGTETLKEGVDRNGHTAAASLIEAGQDIKVKAGRDVNQQGSDLQAERNITLQADRDVNIDAAPEKSEVTTSESVKRNGTTTTVAYNLGKTVDSLSGTGEGEDGVSKGSSVLKAVDALSQFLSGPSLDAHWGASSIGQTQTQISEGNRPSSLSAGNDISLVAGNDVNVRGSQFNTGRDIDVSGKNVTFDVAHGAEVSDGDQTQSKGGLKGGTTGGLKIGVGVSNAGAKDESSQGTSTPTQLNAGGSINLDAKNDLNLIGTQATAERDINLKAGNDLNIRAAENTSSSENSRRSWGAEAGAIAGQGGLGIYGSANIGLGKLEREGVKQQEAYLYAGNQLGFESGRDTTIAGAQIRADEVVGTVGRDLTISSLPDTGKVKGKEFDASLTGSFVGVSGSIGYGQTTGKTNWVENQTVISAEDKLDIRTQNHTQLDGAVLSSDSGNLKLDTDTLGFRDIAGKDKEHGYYLNVSGNYGGSGAQTDKPNKGMEGPEKNSWTVEGYNYNKDREQIVRATVGAGEIVVRNDKVMGEDSTDGLNRDLDKAYEITRDDEHRTELYVSDTSLKAASEPIKTAKEWATGLVNYDKTALANFELAGRIIGNQIDRMQFSGPGEGAVAAGGAEIAAQALSALVQAGYKRKDARVLLEDPKFQSEVLEKLKGLDDLSKASPEKISEVKKVLAEKNVLVKVPGITSAKLALDKVSYINKYITDNPDKAQAVELVMAASQGPKGMILYAAQKVIGETSFAQSVAQLQGDLQAMVGRTIAEGIEGKKLNENVELDSWRLGGGSLMASILLGVATPNVSKTSGRAIQVAEKTAPRDVLGGPHRETTKPVNDGFDSHHCPAKGCYAGAPISSKDGPAIKMTPADHARTASHGNSDQAVAYRAKQEELLSQGKLMEAIDMDVKDIRKNFGDKYDGAIKQMLDYASKLNPDNFKK